jgi:hypothetical protein
LRLSEKLPTREAPQVSSWLLKWAGEAPARAGARWINKMKSNSADNRILPGKTNEHYYHSQILSTDRDPDNGKSQGLGSDVIRNTMRIQTRLNQSCNKPNLVP